MSSVYARQKRKLGRGKENNACPNKGSQTWRSSSVLGLELEAQTLRSSRRSLRHGSRLGFHSSSLSHHILTVVKKNTPV
jgi:predicted secreted protein